MSRIVVDVAAGKIPADLVIKNGKIVNVFSGEIYEGAIAVCGDTIAATGDVDYTIGENTKIIDAKGRYLTPGFIDGHIHPESSNLSIRSFAESVLKHGTSVICTDFHEVGVVAGIEGIEAVLKEAEETNLKVFFIVPSHIPFSPNLETSGGTINPEIIRKALQRKNSVGLSECVGNYILMGYEPLLEALDDTLAAGKSLQGHLPELKGSALSACVAAGVSTDHESLSGEDAVERLRSGCSLMIREGSSAHNLPDVIKPIVENKMDTSNVSIVTDDLHAIDLVEKGHLDESVRTALKCGVDFMSAIQMVTINAARAFQLDRFVGVLAPGRRADINITTGPEDFKVETVIAGGELVAVDGQTVKHYPIAKHDSVLLNTVHIAKPIVASDFDILVDANASTAKVKVMDTLQWIPITTGREVTLKVINGVVQNDINQDVLYIAQVERYGKNGNIGKAFIGGFHMKRGALAYSMGHDNHNIVVIGADKEDMAIAVNRVAELQGGQALVVDGEVVAEISLPIAGLLTDLSADEIAAQKAEFTKKTNEIGSTIPLPDMFLSFICLAAIPMYAVTDHGFIDVKTQSIINPVIEVQ